MNQGVSSVRARVVGAMQALDSAGSDADASVAILNAQQQLQQALIHLGERFDGHLAPRPKKRLLTEHVILEPTPVSSSS